MIDVAALIEAADSLDAYARELQLSSTRQCASEPDWSLEPDAKAVFDRDRALAARLRSLAAFRNCLREPVPVEVIDGEFSDPKTQAALDRYLRKIWRGDNGRAFEVMAACIDSGGHHTQAVYEFCKARIGRRVWAIKGESARNGQRSPVWPTKRPSSRNKATYRPVILGVNAAKDTIRARLLLDAPGSGAFPAGYMHFPADRDMNYFMQLTAERSIVKSVAGSRYRVWEQIPGRANEALDCRVYAYGALCGLLHFGLKLNKRTDAALLTPIAADQIEIPAASDDQAAGTAPAPVARPATKKSLISRLA